MSGPQFERVALIGIGLIGSSLARVLRRNKLAREIVACARREQTLDKVRALALADRVTADPAEAVKGADLVVISTPLSAYADIGRRISPALEPGAIVTDVGSVKEAVIRDLKPSLPQNVHLVPGHPVAGTEHSGPEAGFAELFHDRWCILTPLPDGDAAALARVTALWEAAGMKVVTMDAAHHDKVLAITSHLPHLIAYTIVGTATDIEDRRLPRLHAHRCLRSGDVARRVPQQPRGGVGDAAALHRGPDRAAARHPLGRRRQARGPLHPHPRHPPLDHRGEAGLSPAR